MSIRCSVCGNDNLDQARFCMQCSQPLIKTCAKCGGTAALTARFCPHCGEPVAQQAIPPTLVAFTGRLQPSAVLTGRYQIIRKLGQGGMGAVYLTHDLRLTGKQWAVKEMSDATIADPAERKQAVLAFQQEAQMLATLDHRHLPKVTDYFSEQGNQYLVIEFVPGDTLEKKLEQVKGPLPETQVLQYTEQLCDVLSYLHNRRPQIIFRDLKPTNIMLQPDDQLKLIDFGIARHFKPGQSRDTQAMGTPGYAAPEQYGKEQSDVRSDIYALGATMHHMLTGRDPGVNPFHFESTRKLNPHISQPLDAIVTKAVELKPEQRWQTVTDLSQALSRTRHTPVAPTVSTSPTPVRPVISPPVSPPVSLPQSGMRYASYGHRIAAYITDLIISAVLASICLFIINVGEATTQQGNSDGGAFLVLIGFVLLFISLVFYLIRPVARTGQTFGKRLVRIKVVNLDGNPPGWGRALSRYFIGIVVFEGFLAYVGIGFVGYLWPLWDKDKQAWHDKIAGTYVVEC